MWFGGREESKVSDNVRVMHVCRTHEQNCRKTVKTPCTLSYYLKKKRDSRMTRVIRKPSATLAMRVSGA